MKQRAIDHGAASHLAVSALVFLAQDMDRLGRFLALSGLDPSKIREAASDPNFLIGVLDHMLADEGLLIAFTAEAGIRPDMVAEAKTTLAGPTQH